MKALSTLAFLLRLSALLLAITIATLVVGIAKGQQPENLTVEWRYFVSNAAPLPAYIPQAPVQEGIWIRVFVNDSETEALSITLTYRTEDGRDLSRTELLSRWYRDRAAWTNHLFITGKIQVRSILITALKADKTRLIEVAE